MFRSIRNALVLAVSLVATFSAVSAFGAPATWQTIDVTLHAEQAGGVLIISGDLPESTKLPAEAELAVPSGSTVQWIGEILGGPPSADPALQYTKTTVGGNDVYRFTMTKAKIAQLEIETPAGAVFDGSNYSSAITWTASQSVPEVNMALRLPAGAEIVTPTAGAALTPGDTGYTYYTKTITNVKAGDKLDLSAGYTAPAVAAGAPGAAGGVTPATSSTASTVVPIFLVLGAIALAIFVGFAVRRKMRPANDDAEEYEEYEEYEDTDDVAPAALRADKRAAAPAAAKEATKAKSAGTAKRNLVTAGIVVVFIILGIVIGTQTTKPQATGDKISQTFAQGEACVTASIPLAVPQGSDPRATADKIFAALQPIGGMKNATYDTKTSSIEVGFCESSTSEAAIKQALMPTGLIAQADAAPAATTP
jgi:hypothetical protein